MNIHIKNKIFDVTPGQMFSGKVIESEWFPLHRNDMFDVGFMEKDQKIPKFHYEPKIGDFLAIDFQQDGPYGKIWLQGPIENIEL